MQMCPECGRVYDESEYTKCPYCYNEYANNINDLENIQKKKPVIKHNAKLLTFMEPLPRFELGTLALQVRCSGQLS